MFDSNGEKFFMEIVRTGTTSTSISSKYVVVIFQEFTQVKIMPMSSGTQWVQSPSEVTNESDATTYKIVS